MTVVEVLQLVRQWRDVEKTRFYTETNSETWKKLRMQAESIELKLESVGLSIGRNEETDELVLIPDIGE